MQEYDSLEIRVYLLPIPLFNEYFLRSHSVLGNWGRTKSLITHRLCSVMGNKLRVNKYTYTYLYNIYTICIYIIFICLCDILSRCNTCYAGSIVRQERMGGYREKVGHIVQWKMFWLSSDLKGDSLFPITIILKAQWSCMSAPFVTTRSCYLWLQTKKRPLKACLPL